VTVSSYNYTNVYIIHIKRYIGKKSIGINRAKQAVIYIGILVHRDTNQIG